MLYINVALSLQVAQQPGGKLSPVNGLPVSIFCSATSWLPLMLMLVVAMWSASAGGKAEA